MTAHPDNTVDWHRVAPGMAFLDRCGRRVFFLEFDWDAVEYPIVCTSMRNTRLTFREDGRAQAHAECPFDLITFDEHYAGPVPAACLEN
jgi:hypothetical protein